MILNIKNKELSIQIIDKKKCRTQNEEQKQVSLPIQDFRNKVKKERTRFLKKGTIVRNKKGRTSLGTSKEEQKNDKMGTVTGTLTIELACNKQKKLGVSCMY